MSTVITMKDSPVNMAKFPSSKARDDATVALSPAASPKEEVAKCKTQCWREGFGFLSDVYLCAYHFCNATSRADSNIVC
jgi:hypothetical protein